MFNPDLSGKKKRNNPIPKGGTGQAKKTLRGIFLLAIGMALIAWIPRPAIADEIVWEYSTGLYKPFEADRLSNGNTLIADQGNFRVIEVTQDSTIVWEYNNIGGTYGPYDADRLSNSNTLIALRSDSRVIEVEPDSTIVWEYTGVNEAFSAERLLNGNTLICDDHNFRVIEVAPDYTIVWQYGIGSPRSAERLSNGNTLISSFSEDRVIEVTSDGTIVWELATEIDGVFDAERLANGNTLITDCFNHRIIEVTPDGTIVWEYSTGLFYPADADRLSNGNTLIADSYNHRVIEVGTLPNFDISGNIGYFSNDAPVPNATVSLTGDGAYSTLTITTGDYLLWDIPGGNYVSTPSKDEDLGGLSGLDASRIARFAAGLYSLNCLEMIAGDVSMNGEISGLDASRVARYAVGSITELNPDGIEWVFTPEPIPDCADWPPIVYESTREYSPLNSDLIDEDFIGIRLGDVSGNWSPDSRAILSSESFESTEIEINTNSTIRIPVVIDNMTAIEGIDISIAFDKEVLHLSGLTLGGILAENDYAVESNLKEGKIVIYAQKELVSGAGVFAFMDFDVIGEVGSSSEIYLTRFDVNETEASGGFNVLDSENETVTRRLQVNVGQTLLEKFALYTNNPNPFSTRTLIQYDLPKDTHVIIQVYNVKGQLIEELVNGVESAGRKQIEWNTKDSSSGIYFCRLSTENKTIIKKMVLMR